MSVDKDLDPGSLHLDDEITPALIERTPSIRDLPLVPFRIRQFDSHAPALLAKAIPLSPRDRKRIADFAGLGQDAMGDAKRFYDSLLSRLEESPALLDAVNKHVFVVGKGSGRARTDLYARIERHLKKHYRHPTDDEGRLSGDLLSTVGKSHFVVFLLHCWFNGNVSRTGSPRSGRAIGTASVVGTSPGGAGSETDGSVLIGSGEFGARDALLAEIEGVQRRLAEDPTWRLAIELRDLSNRLADQLREAEERTEANLDNTCAQIAIAIAGIEGIEESLHPTRAFLRGLSDADRSAVAAATRSSIEFVAAVADIAEQRMALNARSQEAHANRDIKSLTRIFAEQKVLDDRERTIETDNAVVALRDLLRRLSDLTSAISDDSEEADPEPAAEPEHPSIVSGSEESEGEIEAETDVPTELDGERGVVAGEEQAPEDSRPGGSANGDSEHEVGQLPVDIGVDPVDRNSGSDEADAPASLPLETTGDALAVPTGEAHSKPVVPPVRAGGGPLDEVLTALLRDDQVAIAARLAAAAGRRGTELPTSPVSFAVAAAARMGFAQFTPDAVTFDQLAIEALADTSDGGQALLFAALLEPCVVRRDTSSRVTVKGIRHQLGEGAGALQREFARLDYAFAPTVEDLQFIGGNVSVDRVPETREAVAAWRRSCLLRNSTHHLSNVVLKHFVSNQGGELSRLLNEIERDSRSCVERGLDVIRSHGDAASVTDRVREIEREMGVSTRGRIQWKKLEWIQRNVLEGVNRVRAWRAAVLDDRRSDVGAHARMGNEVERLRKLAARALEGLPHVTGCPFDDAVVEFVARRLKDFDSFLRGQGSLEVRGLRRVLTEDLDLLPAGCEPRSVDPLTMLAQDPDAETADLLRPEDDAILDALSDGQVADPGAAFCEKLRRGAFATAARLVARCARDDKHAQDLLNDVREQHAEMNAEHKTRIDELLRRLKELAIIDLNFVDDTRVEIDRLNDIRDLLTEGRLSHAPDLGERTEPEFDALPSQHYEVGPIIDEAQCLADRILTRIRTDQVAQLDDLAVHSPEKAEDVARLKERIEETPALTLDDQIAQIREGLPLSLVAPPGVTTFDQFFPEFVEAAVTRSGGVWPKDRDDYASAFAGEDPWPRRLIVAAAEDRPVAGHIMASWFQIMQTLGQGKSSGPAIRTLLGHLGAAEHVLRRPEPISGIKLVRYKAQIGISPDGWFLPPVFGSKSEGKYRVYTCGPTVPQERLDTELATHDRDMATIVFMAGKLSSDRRRKIAESFRRLRLPALVVDETLVAFLATRSRRLATLFACATPFAYVQPYTTDPGRVPPEMFFGRKREIEQITERSADGSLVYGGRQLGKSALLHHVEGDFHDPERGRIALRRDVTYVGRPSERAETIWRRIAEGLAKHGITTAGMTTADEVVDAVRKWLDVESNRRILVLLDETDNFMSAEARSGFANLTRFKELMEVSDRRFKAVFAGLHNVRRTLGAPNSPLHHLGVVCVGPLSQTFNDKRSARRLVLEPLRSAGFRFDSDEAVNDILAYVSHYPSLVQLFLKELVTTLKPSGDGPLWTIGGESLFRGESFATIQASVRDRFHLTLDLDPRYKLIAATLAVMRYDGIDVMKAGVAIERIRKEVRANWPDTMQPVDDMSVRHLLEEMVELGVLGYNADGERRLYRLRTSQITQMIGSQSEVYEILISLNDREANIDYDSGVYRRSYVSGNAGRDVEVVDQKRCPLTDAQVDSILVPQGRSQIVCGLPELGLNDILEALEGICGVAGVWGECRGILIKEVQPTPTAVRRALDSRRGTSSLEVLILRPDWNQVETLIRICDRHPAVRERKVAPVYLLDARDSQKRRFAVDRDPIALQPWGHQMLRAHLEEIDEVGLDRRDLREAMLDATAGLPGELLKLVRALHRDATGLTQSDICSRVDRDSVYAFDIDDSLRETVNAMFETESLSDYNLLVGLIEDETGEDFKHVTRILELLGFVEQHHPSTGLFRLSRLHRICTVSAGA